MNIALRRRVFSSRVALVAALVVLAATGEFVSGQSTRPRTRTVKAFVQPRPGRPRSETEMKVFESPVDLPIEDAGTVSLDDNDLVLGVVSDGVAVAYPVRYLAMFEVVNSLVGTTLVAPTW